MTTLFSPVGTADPITRLGDGPMLHIVRHCKPDKVVLYLSQKMKGYQEKDGRYTKAIELMCETEGLPIPRIQLRECPDEQVFRFDWFIDRFERMLEELCDESADEPVLVNVSSGTPAMEQALVALGSFGRLPIRMLQVPTPRHDVNRQGDREKQETYDFGFMWAYNEELRKDDPQTCKSRIIVVETPNFADRLIRESVASLVENYDYEGAFRLACGTNGIRAAGRQMILASRDRLNLYGVRSERAFGEGPLSYCADDLLGEHLSVMEVRLAQGHWADFMRLLSPAFAALADEELSDCGLEVGTLLKKRDDGSLTQELDWDLVQREDRVRRTLDRCAHKPYTLSNDVRIRLIDEYCPDRDVRRMFGQLRTAERNCRNNLAHELQVSDRAILERMAGIQLSTIMQHLFAIYEGLRGYVRLHLYDDINVEIIENL